MRVILKALKMLKIWFFIGFIQDEGNHFEKAPGFNLELIYKKFYRDRNLKPVPDLKIEMEETQLWLNDPVNNPPDSGIVRVVSI